MLNGKTITKRYLAIRFVYALYGAVWLYWQLFRRAPLNCTRVMFPLSGPLPPYGVAYRCAQTGFKVAYLILAVMVITRLTPNGRFRERLNLFWLLCGLFGLTFMVWAMNVGYRIYWEVCVRGVKP